MALVETGTRGLLGAVFGSTETGERGYATRLLPLLSREMLVLMDRGFDSAEFFTDIAATGAQILARLRSERRPAVLAVLPDGSYLTRLGTLKVRIIEASVTVTTTDGQILEQTYLLGTTLLDHRTDPAEVLVRLYHERWEIETAFYALRHTLLNGRVLRSQDWFGLEQEIWSLLTMYQLVRRAMAEAVESVPGLDPDRASFIVAMETARTQVILAAGILPDDDSPGVIGGAVLGALLPSRRSRTSARKVKAPMSRYPGKNPDPRPLTSTNVTVLTVAIIEPAPAALPAPPRVGHRELVLRLLRSEPDRDWHSQEIAERTGQSNIRSLWTELNMWTRDGMLLKIKRNTYELAAQWRQSPPSPAGTATTLTDGVVP